RDQLEAAMDGRTSEVPFQVFDRSDGIPTMDMSAHQPNAVKDAAGRLWFATMRGAALVDPRVVRINTLPPPVAIEELLLDGRTVPLGDPFMTSQPPHAISVDVAPGTRRLEIHYGALSYVSPQKVRYRYQLEGIDRDWVDVGDSRVDYLQDLKPGH